MKQNKTLVLACLFTFVIAGGMIGFCIGKTATRPAISTNNDLRDYQIELYNDTVWVYDADRLVDKYTSTFTGQLDSVLLKDNQ